MIKVFGHQSPDTDATASAIVWAWFLQEKRGQEAKAFVLGTPNTEALFVLDRWDYMQPELLETVSAEDTVAIVDTNNHDELFENINETNIVSIIDHHKLVGGLETDTPIEIIIQPYASTMTVIFTAMNMQVNELPQNIAGLMLSGIISDTLAFRSPTTTAIDQNLAEELAEHVDVSIEEYAGDMFKAKSDISTFSEEELVLMDSKVFDVDDKKIRVSVLETTSPQSVLDRQEQLVSAMETITAREQIDLVMMFVVDILEEQSTLLLPNELTKQIAQASFAADISDETVLLKGIVSRKKQIVPVLKTT